MTATTLGNRFGNVGASDIESLVSNLDDVYDLIVLDDPDGEQYTVVDYLTDDAQRFAAGRAISGEALSHNPATARALAGAIVTLEAFHAAELRPVTPRTPRRYGY